MKRNLTLKHLDFRTGLHRLRFFLLFMTLGLCSVLGNAQVANYSFTQGTGTYTPLTSPTVLGTPTGNGLVASLDDIIYNIPSGTFPFPFTFSGAAYTGCNVSTNGFITFGTTAPATNLYVPISGATGYNGAISAWGKDLNAIFNIGGFTGNISWGVEGVTPNREIVFQWAEWRPVYENSATNAYRINIQLRLAENGNTIRIVYGPSGLAGGTPAVNTTCEVGLRGASNADFNNRTATTTWATTTAGGTNAATMAFSLTNMPANGTFFMWTPPPPCVAPTSLAASVTGTATTPSTISGSFTAAPVPSSGYVVVRTSTNTQPTIVDGTTYTVGTNAIGYIEYVGTTPGSWNSLGLTTSTPYYYWVFTYNNAACSGGPKYSTTAATTSVTTLGCTFPAGTYTVGATGNLPSLTAAIAYLTACPQTGAYVFELLSDYNPASETYPITFPNLAGSSASNTVTIRPAAGSTASLTSANSTATLRLDGMDYLILDGRPGGTGTPKTLVIENTNAAGVAIQFINDATNNLVEYATIRGVNSTTSGGVVLFGTTTGTTGNDNNTIDNCDIRDGATTPSIGIFSLGSTASAAVNNSNNTVSNNNIYNFFSAGGSSFGISLSTGNTDWTINGNHLYQTASRTGTTGSTHTGINLSNTATGNNFVVTGNFIGGSTTSAGGTAWTMGGAVANRFVGINVNVGTTTASSIQNNTIANFTWSSTSGATALPGVWAGIYIVSGAANVGTVTGNTIGSGTGTGSISVTSSTTGAVSLGIGIGSGAAVAVSNNTIGSVTVLGSAAGISHSFNGIWNTGTPTTLTINNNLVGSLATANSINASNASTSGTVQFVNGILSTGGTAVTVTNNTVANLNNAYVPSSASSASIVRGIVTSGASNTVTGNTVRNLSTAANATGTSGSASVIGISQTSTTAGQTVSQNTVYALGNTHATTAVSVIGIHMGSATTGTNLVNGNLVHSLSVSSSSATADIRGINVSAGVTTYQNNMVRLGIDASGASLANGLVIYGIYDVAGTNNYYHNTVYVGGTGVAGTAATYAFRSDVTTNVRAFLNNIFINARANGAGTGKQYAIRLAGTTVNPAGLTSNGNVYQATGTGGVFGFFNSADVANLAAWQTAVGKDANSVYADPCLAAPAAATPDLHLTNCSGAGSPANAAGVTGTGVTLDFDGATRSGLTPIDIGADAGNYGPTGLDLVSNALVAPSAGPGCKTNAETVTATIINNSTNPIDFSVNNATVTVTTAGGYTSSMVLNTGTLAGGASQNVTMPATIDMTANGAYAFTITTAVTGDVNTANNVLGPVNINILSLGGTYTVGVGGNYTTLTAAVADYNNASCFTAPVIFSLTDANYSASETFPITVNANAAAGATYPLTIRPATGVTPLITGSNAVAIIKLNGADYVTIDGSNNGTTTRDLTVENTNAGTAVIGIWLASVNATNGATNNTIKNTVVRGQGTTSLGAIVSSGTAAGGVAETANSNNSYINNSVSKAQYGIAAVGPTGNESGTVITGNEVGSTVTANKIAQRGIGVFQQQNVLISNNKIAGVVRATADNGAAGIFAGGTISGGTIEQNTITDIKNTNTDGYAASGILLASSSPTTGISIKNNFISNVTGFGYDDGDITTDASDNGHGININTGGGYNVYFNTVNMATNQGSAGFSAALYIASAATALDIRNNILVNTQTTGTRYAVLAQGTNSAFTTINYNDYYSTGSIGYLGSTRATLANWKTATGQDVNSLNILPVFTSATDLHLALASNLALIDGAISIPSVTVDIDGAPRGTSPDMGADEFGNRPAAPTSLTQSVITPSCTGGSVLYALPAAPANVTYYLQANATDTLSTTPLVGDSITVFTNGTYYVNAKNSVTGLWSSTSTSVTVANIPVAPLPPSPVPALTPACLSTTISVPAPSNPSVTYYWQGTTSGGTSNTQNAATPLTVTASGTYYVAAFDASSNCWSNTNGVAVVIDTQVPVAPSIQPAAPAICIGNGQSLAASLAALSSPSGTGTAITAGNVNGVTLGPNPFQNYYGGNKQQMLFTAAELTAMGVQPNTPITSISIDLASADATYSLAALQVKMGPTAVTALSTWITGLTVVRPAAAYAPVVGANTIALPAPYTWNGTDNLVVEINYSNNNGGTTGTTFNTATYSTTPNVSTLFYRVDNATAAAMNTYTGAPSFTYSARNNVRFAPSVPAGYTFTWSPNNHLFTDNTATTPSTGTANNVYAKPDTTITYGVTSHLGACSSTPTAVTVTVNPLPVVDAGATQTVCPGDTVTLSGTGATNYTWNNGVTNNTPFVATATTLYTVTGTDANACSATDTVSVIVKPGSLATITPSGPLTFCQNESLTLTAGGPANGPATVITQWNFNASNFTPSTGTGTATLVGGTTSAFQLGTGSTDPGLPNNALNTLTYPLQGTGNRSAGIQYNVSTAGYTNVSLTYDVRFSGTAANTYIVQYNPDVTNGFSPWLPVDTNVYSVDGAFINNQTINLSSVPAAQNNPNFGIRIVSGFAGSTSAYAPVNAANYGTGGTVRYDMVTFTGNPVPYTVLWTPGNQTTYSINPTTSGTYTVTVTETGICSGTASVNVTVNPVATTVVNPVICADATYTLVDGTQVSATGIYTRTTTSVVTGCDSVVVANLTVNPVYNTPVAVTICSNEQYTLADGSQVDTADTYTTIVPTVLGCDSTVVVTLTVLPADASTVTASICANETYTLPNGTVVSTAGSYPNTFTSVNGCDSIITTTLTVKPVFTTTQNPVICQGDSHTMPDGSTEDTAGTYEFPYTAVNGCDSTITVNLTVNPVYTTNITVNICPDEDYTLVDGTVVDADGTYTAVTSSASGCDSTVIAVVTVHPDVATTVNASICQGDTYTLVNGSSVTTAGMYVSATQTIYGCDSVVTVNLTLKPVYNQTVAETVCQGETYTLPDGTNVTAAGVYTSQLTTVGGCDSTIVTTLTVSPLPNLNLGNDIVVQNPPVILNAGAGFTSYDWSTGAQTQTITVNQNGTFSVTVTNAAGCEATDSISVNFTASIVNLGENGGSITLFPNPASDRFAINVYGYTGGGSMKLDLINAVGQVVKTEWVANAAESFTKEMDIATLPSGSYTLRVKGTNAEANLRLIIAR